MPRRFEIVEKEVLNPNITRISMYAPLISAKAKAGQFVILRSNVDAERIPLTISSAENGCVDVIYQKIGASTIDLDQLNVGDCLADLAGPLGKPTPVEGYGHVAVVGGGLGCAIALPVARALHEAGNKVELISGFKTKDLVILEKEMKAASTNLYMCTDDGTYGYHGFVTNKLEEHGLVRSTKMVEIAPHQKFKLGCFTVEPIHVNHSIPDAVALAITCPAGTIIQTGDFKIDYTPISGGPTDLVTIAEYGEHGVLALLSDSTNAERPGFTATEQKVGASMEALFSRAGKKRIIIATFASNLYRVQQLIDLAVKAGRKVAVSGRSMVNNTQMALELGYLHAPETVLIDIEDINKYPPEKIVLITTGSQGEPLSALSRMAAASHRNVRVGEGDFIIISANPIPGNEKMVTKVVNGLLKLGAEVIYESMYDVHVSGHACQEEQKLMLTLAKPQFFLPVHGEYKHLKKHAQTAAAVGIPEKNIYIGENGDCVVLSADGLTVGEPVPAGAVMVDGLGVGDVGNVVLRDRRHLSEDGLVIVVATIDARTGEVLAGPDLVSRGFVYVRESEKLLDDARDQVRDVLGRMSAADKRDFGSVKTRIRETVSAFLYRKTKRSPMILPILMEV